MSDPLAIDQAVRRAQGGDNEAFGELIRLLELPVRTYVTGRCPPGADADDIAQATFVEAFRNLGRYEPGTDFRAWLFTIARYQVMGELTRLRRLADQHERYVPHALWIEFERRALATEPSDEPRLEALRICMGALPEADRQVLDRRYVREQPLQAMSAELGRSVGALKKHLFLLRQKLHECLLRRIGSGERP